MQLALLPLLVASVLPSSGDGPFVELCFEDALARAGESEKLVFIDFFTTWCGPCKKLDQVTWKDAEVVAWLEEHTVPLKFDAEIEVELAARYGVAAFPTLVFIEPDGALRATLVGYHAPEQFVNAASNAVAGITALEAARAALAENPTDWHAHSELADALVLGEQYHEALEHYLWCFDHGLEDNPGYVGVRLSFLLSDLKSLGRVYPVALDAMRSRRDAAGERLLLMDADATAATRDFCALNRELGEPERSLEMYERLAEVDEPLDRTRSAERRAQLFDSVLDLLMKAERYAEVIDGFGDFQAWLEDEDVRCSRMAAYAPAPESEIDYETRLRGRTVRTAALLYLAMASVEGERALPDLEHALVAFHPVAGTWRALMHAARKAGRRDLQERLRAAALERLPEAEHQLIPRVQN